MTSERYSVIYFVVLLGLILLSAAGVYFSLEIAVSAYNSLGSTLAKRSAAVLAIPWSAEYQVRLADLRRATGLPFTNNLADAVRNSPADSRLWIQLALAQEQDGNLKSAEASLLRAGSSGRDYDTRWALANFYFRRANRDQTLVWACAVLSIPGVEGGPVFSLLANFPAKPDCILRDEFGGPESARLDYLQWLISRAALDAAGPVAELLIRRGNPGSVPALFDYCDRLLFADKIQLAVRLWNKMSQRGLVHAPVAFDGTLTDEDLRLADPPHALAWLTPAIDGVDSTASHPGLQISLSGIQPDKCELLSQWVPLGTDVARALRYRYVTSGIAPGSGVHWKISTPKGVDLWDTAFPSPDIDLYDGADSEGFIRFKAPSGSDMIRVSLVYERPPTAAPVRGWIRLEKVWLTE